MNETHAYVYIHIKDHADATAGLLRVTAFLSIYGIPDGKCRIGLRKGARGETDLGKRGLPHQSPAYPRQPRTRVKQK